MLETAPAVSYVADGTGETFLVITDLVTVKVRSQDSRGTFALTEVVTPPGGGPPGLHRHADQETFYVLEGVYRFDTLPRDQPESLEAARGAVVHIPSRLWHNYQNIGQAPGRLLVVLQPGALVDFFRELGVPVSDPANPPRSSGPPDLQRLQAITQKHQVEIYHPPQSIGADNVQRTR